MEEAFEERETLEHGPPEQGGGLTKNIHPGWILALVCLPIFIGALDLTVVSAVIPPILADLQIPYQTGLDDAAWMVSGYLLAYTISITFMGRVSDIWGRRLVYVICLAVFILGSVIVAVAPETISVVVYRAVRTLASARPERAFTALYTLIFGRVVQAFGAGALVPVSMALVGDIFPVERRATALGIIGGVDTAGWVLGHLYGGIMVQYFPWPVLFWLNVPIAGIALVLTAWFLNDLTQTRATGKLDWLGATIITLSLTGLNLALNNALDKSLGLSPDQITRPALSYPLLLLTILGLFIFVLIERRSPNPLINFTAFRNPNFSAANLANLLMGFCIMAGLVSVPIYMNTVPVVSIGLNLDQAALLAGYLLGTFTIPMALVSFPGGWLTNRIGYRWTTVLGAALATAGYWLISRWNTTQSEPIVRLLETGVGILFQDKDIFLGTFQMTQGLILGGIGIGITIAPIATAVINAVPATERGAASGLVIVMRLIGMTLSISILTNFGLHRSQTLLSRALKGIEFTDFAAQVQVLVESTTQVINEISLITGGVCLGALLVAMFLSDRRSF